MDTNSKRYFSLIILLSTFIATTLVACKEKKSSLKHVEVLNTSANNDFFKEWFADTSFTVDTLDTFNISKELRYAYTKANFRPYWLRDGFAYNNVSQLIDDIASLRDDGLSPESYKIKDIRRSFEKVKTAIATPEELAAFDTTCTYYYLLASRDLLMGRLKVNDVDTEWFHKNDTAWMASSFLYDSLYSSNRYPNLSIYKSKLTAYENLKKERKRYTSLEDRLAYNAIKSGAEFAYKDREDRPLLHPETLANEHELKKILACYYKVQLPPIDDSIEAYDLLVKDSVIRKIDVNLERLRWLPQDFEDLYLIVNVPAMDLYLNIDNKDTMHMRVVIGKKSRATPTMSADMVNIVFNPTWTVPPGIMKKDIIPGMNAKGSAYLEKKGLAIFTHSGKPLNPDSITVTKSNFKNYVFRQPSGYKNALGRVKFNLPNKHNIYLHDTPSRSDFKKKNRDKSSGCIRVQHPRDMAGYILTKINKEKDSKHFVDSLINKNKMIYVPLEKRIPVHILYLTATEDSAKQHVVYWDDIYDKDEAIALRLK